MINQCQERQPFCFIFDFTLYKGTDDDFDGGNEYLNPENICFDTKINFLSPLLKKLWEIYDQRLISDCREWRPFCFLAV